MPAFSQDTFISFVDKGVEKCALKAADRDSDGRVSLSEANAMEALNLTPYRIDLFEVSTYEDIRKFPNLKQIWLGDRPLETVNLFAVSFFYLA